MEQDQLSSKSTSFAGIVTSPRTDYSTFDDLRQDIAMELGNGCNSKFHLARNCDKQYRSNVSVVSAEAGPRREGIKPNLRRGIRFHRQIITNCPPRHSGETMLLGAPEDLLGTLRTRGLVKDSERWQIYCVTLSLEKFRVVTRFKVSVKISGLAWPLWFLVAPRLVTQIILGHNFFRWTRTTIDLYSGTISFKSHPGLLVRLTPLSCPDTPSTTVLEERRNHIPKFEAVLAEYPDVVCDRIEENNPVAYSLSRMFEEPNDHGNSGPQKVQAVLGGLRKIPEVFTPIGEAQRRDPEWSNLIQSREDKSNPDHLKLLNGSILIRPTRRAGWKVYVPLSLVMMIFACYHESPVGGHLSPNKTIGKICLYFYRKEMKTEIRDWVRMCEVCLRVKPVRNNRYGMLNLGVASVPLDRVFMDLFGPLPRSRKGHDVLLTIVDGFSKFVWITPLRVATSNSVVDALVSKLLVSSYPGVQQHEPVYIQNI
uniref:Integrase catalytic domain-containing protein n=1 Tax=Timema poppense TaxID=170557 RepID=A0A7R9HC82_TIMPO|nr:unnamed protein product [Timema poppensis]